VGTHLAAAYDQPALGGVYKLAAVRRPGAEWERKVKVSDQAAKVSTPGILQVRRFFDDSRALGDAIYDVEDPIADGCTIVDPSDATRRKAIRGGTRSEDLLAPVFRGGTRVCDPPALEDSRRRAREQLDSLHPAIKRLMNPHRYPAGLERTLHDRKMRLILRAKGFNNSKNQDDDR
jgi:nicotinate phosphoribosyltransferase